MTKIAMMGEIHNDGWELLKKQNYDVFEIKDFSNENLIKELHKVSAVGLRTAALRKEVLENCPNIKIISRHGVGYDNVDLDYLNENNQALGVTGTSNAVSVAEHVMTMFLYLAKKINKSDNLVRMGNFKKKSSIGNFFELYQKNILILGFGRIGQAVSKRCLGFDANVIVYDPFIDSKLISERGCTKVEFEEGINQADFITVHMPLSNQTKNLINKKQFEKMKDNVIIVNTARGGIINEEDLYWALKNKKIYGAGTDVYETEPPIIDAPLFSLENIIFTPHNAALTLECRKRMAIEMAENIVFYLEDDKKLNKKNIINKEILNL
jgi:D-3-phosphoglycerate dehydrogenase|tara:strand:- start:493 stop:1464 length:972 start_codon:yes stop_codon:yes gene_type:complete